MKGKWIAYYRKNEQFNEDKYLAPAPYFRKEFAPKAGIKKVELKIAALGWFKAYINGREITENEEFTTPWTDYNKRIEFSIYDITDKIGKINAIGAVLGNGWACGSIMWGQTRKYYNVGFPRFIAEIILSYENGESESICTDGTWKANVGEILYNDILYGEYIDRRRTLGNYSAPGYNDGAWENACETNGRTDFLTERTCPRITVKERLELKFVHVKKGKRIYTTGQNLSGILECKIKGERGAKLIFRYGEMLDKDGNLYTENLRSAECTDTYVCGGGENEIFRPLFTYHGFQFVEVTVEGEAEILSADALAICSDLDMGGKFETSSVLVNKIYSNIVWGLKSNFLSVPTDCPQRDERLGWLGDLGVFARSAMYIADCKDFFAHFLSVITEAMKEDGAIPCIAPCAYGFLDNAVGASAWADAFIILLNDLYDFYGDISILEKYFPYAEKFIAWVEKNSENYRRKTYCFSDWLSVNADIKEGYGDVDFQLFDLCFYALDCLFMDKFSRVLGKSCDYNRKYERAKDFFKQNLIVNGYPIGGGRQTASILAFEAGLLGVNDIKKSLVCDLKKNGLTCGFVGVKRVLPVLCEIGRSDLAYELVTSEKYPSWGYSVKNGATTVWERWDSYTKENGFHDSGMNSFNHYAFGSCAEWFYSHVLGINPEKAGFSRILIKPYIDFSGKINEAFGSYNSSRGEISVKWKVDGDTAVLEVCVPDETAVSFDFFGALVEREEQSYGKYAFRLKKKIKG